MAELVQQVSLNAIPLSVFLFTCAAFLSSLAWAAIAITKMLQIMIATNLSVSMELAAIQKSVAGIVGNSPQPISPIMPSSAPEPKWKGKNKQDEGEAYGYDEVVMAENEKVRQLRLQSERANGGLTDEELDAQIARQEELGFGKNDL